MNRRILNCGLPGATVLALAVLILLSMDRRSQAGEISGRQLAEDLKTGRITKIVAYEDSETKTLYYGDPPGSEGVKSVVIRGPSPSMRGISVDNLPAIVV